jgi:hypothetical protein
LGIVCSIRRKGWSAGAQACIAGGPSAWMVRGREEGTSRPASPDVEGGDGGAHGLLVAAQLVGNPAGDRAPRRGEQDLAAAQDKGVRRGHAGAEVGVSGRTTMGRFIPEVHCMS